jgi:PhnB protein
MAHPTNGVPEGFHTVTPYMVIQNAADAITFYKKAFGATELFRWADADGKIRHAEIKIGDSPLMITDEPDNFPDMRSPQTIGGSPVSIFLYVDDVDAWIKRAGDAGAKVIAEPKDENDGDRRGGVSDPFGYTWWIGTQREAISRADLQKRYDALKT